MIIDTNVYLSRWPFSRLRHDDPRELVKMLRQHDVTEAWTGSFDALLHEDIAAVNERLAEDCRRHGKKLLLPFGSVNPALPDWEEDLRRCHEEHRMRGIRLHPNYHGYTLTDRVFERLLRMAAERGLLVQLTVRMQDERVQHPRVKVPPVDLAPLGVLIDAIPKLRLVLLNTLKIAPTQPPPQWMRSDRVAFDIAMLEGVGGVAMAAQHLGPQRLVFGSYAPRFPVESSALKMRESDLSDEQTHAITHANAHRLMEPQP